MRLWRQARVLQHASRKLWATSFLATALAAFAGGTHHGFVLYLGDAASFFVWQVTLCSIGLGSFLLLTAAICAVFRGPARRWLLAAATLKLVVYLLWTAVHDDFKYVVYFYVPDMLGVLALAVCSRTQRASGAAWIILGILATFAAAAVQRSGFDLHQHFNHNDLYHLVQAAAFFLLYKGGRQMRDA